MLVISTGKTLFHSGIKNSQGENLGDVQDLMLACTCLEPLEHA